MEREYEILVRVLLAEDKNSQLLIAGCQYWRCDLLEEPLECHWKIMA